MDALPFTLHARQRALRSCIIEHPKETVNPIKCAAFRLNVQVTFNVQSRGVAEGGNESCFQRSSRKSMTPEQFRAFQIGTNSLRPRMLVEIFL
jgi:hypothetical protein